MQLPRTRGRSLATVLSLGLAILLLLTLQADPVESQRRGGGRKRTRGGTRGKGHNIITNYKNKESKAYYSHKDGAKITVWSHFESEYSLGNKIVFMCTAEGNPLPHITWYKNGIELYAHSFFQVHEWKISDKTVKSKMEIDPATQMDAGYYECHADNKYSVDVKGFRTDYYLVFD